jgi:hypothetical protein
MEKKYKDCEFGLPKMIERIGKGCCAYNDLCVQTYELHPNKSNQAQKVRTRDGCRNIRQAMVGENHSLLLSEFENTIFIPQ